MKRETYEAQKAFAGEKKPSMLRRCVGHDYTGRQIYMMRASFDAGFPLVYLQESGADAAANRKAPPVVAGLFCWDTLG